MMNEFKQCKVCNIEKSIIDFPLNKKYRLNTCKKCTYNNSKKRLQSDRWKQKIEERYKYIGKYICKTCNLTKDFSEFHKSGISKNGRNSNCKICHHKKVIEWRKNNRQKTHVYSRTAGLKSRYGITDNDFNNMVKKQDNKCLICNEVPRRDKAFQTWNLHVDHCHNTGKVRGLLCHLCNRALGLFRERIDLVEKALLYLKSHS